MEAFPIQGTLKYTRHFSKLLSFLCLSEQIAQIFMPKQFGPEKCPVYLRAPWIGKASIGLDKNLKRLLKAAMTPLPPEWYLHSNACCL